MDLRQIAKAMVSLVEEKGWYAAESPRPQAPRNLAISLSLEAAEILEHFQWNEEADREAVAEELADVILYAVQLGTVLDLDLEAAVAAKLAANRLRTWPTPRGGRAETAEEK